MATKYWRITELYTNTGEVTGIFFSLQKGHVISLKDGNLENCYLKLSIHKKCVCVCVCVYVCVCVISNLSVFAQGQISE